VDRFGAYAKTIATAGLGISWRRPFVEKQLRRETVDDIQKAVRACLTKYAEFNGRAERPEFWWFVLAQLVVGFILNMVLPILGGIFSLAMLVPSLAVGARRLHDIGKSGWLQLLGLIPIIGWILLIYWAAQPGETGSNQYGPPARGEDELTTIAPGQQ
jgi:uncharacterized membrane protein YhaH (DUF805 family)